MVWLGSALVVFLLDQATKLVVLGRMVESDSIPVMPGVFHITLVRNPGGVFGIIPWGTDLLIISSFVVIIILLFFLGKAPRLALPLGILLGGAAGNLLDRLRFGRVTDFLDFRIWPVFNVADVAMVVAAGLMILHVLKYERGEGP